MSNHLLDYFEALERLELNKPMRVPLGTRITNDAVSLEAGRGKGSIKKSRAIFQELVTAIERASAKQNKSEITAKETLNKAKQSAIQHQEALDAALAREICLLQQLYLLKKKVAELTGASVLPIREK